MSPSVAFLAGAALVLALVLICHRRLGFLAQNPADYTEGEPLDLRRHLNGPLICEGAIYGPTGRVASRFVGHFHVAWEGNTGTMDEEFRYDDGSVKQRKWTLSLGNDGRIRARADDLEGEGTGQQLGSAVRLRYRLKLDEAQGGHVLDTTDWMYLAPNGTIINRSQFRKCGFKVAELIATMRPKRAT